MIKIVINVDLGKHLVDTMDAHLITPDINLENILKAVSYELGIPIEYIKSECREGVLPDVRKLYCLLAREYTGKSLSKIGELINRDHSTVLFASKKAKYFMESKSETVFINTYNYIKERLNLT